MRYSNSPRQTHSESSDFSFSAASNFNDMTFATPTDNEIKAEMQAFEKEKNQALAIETLLEEFA